MKQFQWKDGYQGEYWFAWGVSAEGYRLVDDKEYRVYDSSSKGTPYTASPWLVAKSNTEVPYNPLDKPDLHRKFAALRNDKELLAFADKYGLLGREVPLVPVSGGGLIYGESLARWHTELGTMGSVLQIWDWAVWNLASHDENPNAGKLGQIFSWQGNDKILLRMITKLFWEKGQPRVLPLAKSSGPKPGYRDEVLSVHEPRLTKLVKRGEVTKLARYYVCREVNRRLRGHVSPQLLPFSEDIKDVSLFPDSLLTALWGLFMREITGNVKMLRCPICERHFEVTGSRSIYCSSACRQKAWEQNNPDKVRAKRERKGKQ